MPERLAKVIIYSNDPDTKPIVFESPFRTSVDIPSDENGDYWIERSHEQLDCILFEILPLDCVEGDIEEAEALLMSRNVDKYAEHMLWKKQL